MALQATGFDGLVSLEIFSDRFRAGSARNVAIDGQRSLLYMLDNLCQATGAPMRGMALRFLDDFFGSGVQQIALASDDIFATVDRLTANGVALLPIPENYYDDIAARVDLAAPVLDRLRAGNILYDCEGPAEFSTSIRGRSRVASSSRSFSAAVTKATAR